MDLRPGHPRRRGDPRQLGPRARLAATAAGRRPQLVAGGRRRLHANTPAGAWTDRTVIGTDIPDSHRNGQAADDNWDTAVATLNSLDPARVFSSDFLDGLLG